MSYGEEKLLMEYNELAQQYKKLESQLARVSTLAVERDGKIQELAMAAAGLDMKLASEKAAREKAEEHHLIELQLRTVEQELRISAEQKLEAAEQRIRDSQEQEPVGWWDEELGDVDWPNMQKPKLQHMGKIYAQPIIPPTVEELRRDLRIAKAHEVAEAGTNKTLAIHISALQHELAGKDEAIAEFNRKLKDVTKERDDSMRENAELTARFDTEFRRCKELERKLAEQQALNDDVFGAARSDGSAELNKLLSERSVPEGWTIQERRTCFVLLCGNEVIATLAGPEASENARTIAVMLSELPQPKEQT